MAGVEAIIMELHTMAVVTMVAMEEVGKAGIMVEVMVGAGVMLLPKD